MATILVVDDSSTNRQFLAALLGSVGHDVREAPDGAAALAMAREAPPDLIFSDILMPRMDGYEFVRRLRSDDLIATIPVIFQTAFYQQEEADALARKSGVFHLLRKPTAPKEILRVVAQVLDRPQGPLRPVEPTEFHQEHLHLLNDTLVRKVNELESLNRRLKALIDLGRSLALEHDPCRLLEEYCEAGRELLGANYTVLGVLEDDGERFRHFLTSGLELETSARIETPSPREGFFGQVLGQHTPVQWRVDDFEEQYLTLLHRHHYVHVNSILGVRLDTPTRHYGLLCFADKRDAEEFTAEDRGVAEALAVQLAIAFENSRHRADTKQQIARLELEVTERRQAEATLRESEQRFRELAENIHDVFWLVDLEADLVLYVSPSYEEIWGDSRSSLNAGRSAWSDMIHPEDRDRVLEAIRSKLSLGTFDESYRIIRPDGTERWIQDRAFLVPDESGISRRVAGIAKDITERKQAERALERYSERLATLRQSDQAILAAHRPREVAEAALRHLYQLIPAWDIDIWVFDFGGETAEKLAYIGDRAPIFNVGKKVPMEWIGLVDIETLLAGRDCVVQDVALLPQPPRVIRVYQSIGLRSYVRMPLGAAGELIGSLRLGWDRPGIINPEHMEIARDVANQLTIAIRHALLFDEVHSGRERLETLSRQLLKAQEEERRRIARELHDEIGQSLTAVKINLHRAMGCADIQSSLPCLEESRSWIDRILQQVRDLSLDLRPSVLDDLGLVAALRWYLDRTAQRAGFLGRLVANPKTIRVPPDIEIACFRVAQEALTNVARHSRARHAEIILRQDVDDLELLVRDDGAGFDVESARQNAIRGQSLGLLGMEERTALLRGRIVIDAAPGRGTEVHVWLPVPSSATSLATGIGEAE